MTIKHYLLLGAAAFIIIVSFFMPNAVAGVTDMRRLDNLVMIDSQRASFDASPELALNERISLAASSNTEMLPLSTGNYMDNETAGEIAVQEITRFFRGGSFELDYEELSFDDGSAALVIDSIVPTRNMIIWEFLMHDPAGNSVSVTIDDETGLIVRIVYRLGNRNDPMFEQWTTGTPDDVFFIAARILTEMMTEYYGQAVILADYQFSGNLSYYRADMSGGGITISMYGVVRASSFTMNERV